MFLTPNKKIIIPEGQDLSFYMPSAITPYYRNETRQVVTFNNTDTKTLSFTPICPEWLQLFDKNGRAVINRRIDTTTGKFVYDTYNVNGNQLVLSSPQTDYFVAVSDNTMPLNIPKPFLEISFDTTQGVQKHGAQLVEPIIYEEPISGMARISADRLGIIYRPNENFSGTDGFSYILRSFNGQISKVYCVQIDIL